MDDCEAFDEADRTIDYLANQCMKRDLDLTIRLNPMYAAKGSRWARIAHQSSKYQPPRLSDVMRLAEKKTHEGIRVYIGLSTEGLDDGSNYSSREDYSPSMIREIKLFNDGKITKFGRADKDRTNNTLSLTGM
jgi:hypothetical protein